MSDDSECNPDQYQVDFPDVRYEGPLADAPLPFKVWKVCQFLTAVTREAAASLAGGAELPALLAGLAAVDYMAGLHGGRETKGADYIDFLSTYFPSRYRPHAEPIYLSLRCGLMHNLVVVNPWRGRSSEPPFLLVPRRPDHLQMLGDRRGFSIHQFLVDVWCAWMKFMHAVLTLKDPEHQRSMRFERRFDRLEGAGAFMVQEERLGESTGQERTEADA